MRSESTSGTSAPGESIRHGSILRRRIAALLIDYLLILGWIITLLGVTLIIDFSLFGGIPDFFASLGSAGSEAIGFLCLTLPVGAYLFVTESGRRHATVGKSRMGLRVVRLDGAPPDRTQILLRTVVKLLPWEFAHFLVFQVTYYSLHLRRPDGAPAWILVGLLLANVTALAYVAIVLFTPMHRGPHDFAARTVVRE